MRIPILNIYHLLCYAWDKLDEKERINVDIDHHTKLVDLLAKVLVSASKILLKRGVEKSYVSNFDEIRGVKGKLLVSESLKRNILYKQFSVCDHDEYSINILSNQILFTTIRRLISTEGLDGGLKSELVSIRRMLPGIEEISLTGTVFQNVSINRNNRFYSFIMNVCRLVFESILPSENKGKYIFSDFTRDERRMAALFESFVRNFYKREQTTYESVKRENIKWNFEFAGATDRKYLPQMQTDITLENENMKVIIDVKYSKETMVMNYDREKIRPINLYQIFSYLINQEDGSEKSSKAAGILLYPTIERDYDLDYKYAGHEIRIRTVNLNTDWPNIHDRLLSIIQMLPSL
jgi:5-methylcytosine-specific restriction enzyme subunit McrC